MTLAARWNTSLGARRACMLSLVDRHVAGSRGEPCNRRGAPRARRRRRDRRRRARVSRRLSRSSAGRGPGASRARRARERMRGRSGLGIRSELHEPPRSTVAAIRQVRFDTRDGREAQIVVTVSPEQRFSVQQGRARNIDSYRAAAARAIVARYERLFRTAAAAGTRRRRRSRGCAAAVCASAVASRAAAAGATRALRVAARRRAGRDGRCGTRRRAAGRHVRCTSTSTARVTARWQELRLGFFASEQEARAFAAALPAPYANSIVVVADPAEQERALAAAASPVSEREADPPEAPSSRPAPLTPRAHRGADGRGRRRDARCRSRHGDSAVRPPARGCRVHGAAAARASAWDLRASARGNRAQRAPNTKPISREFPADADAERVRQRLAGLAAAAPAPVDPVATAAARDPDRSDAERSEAASRWDVSGGMAQYVRYMEVEPARRRRPQPRSTRICCPTSTSSCAVHGERFELAASHRRRLSLQLARGGRERRIRATSCTCRMPTSNVTDGKHDWQARVGRQSRYGSGIVGRFDGAHVRYQWRPDDRAESRDGLSRGSSAARRRHAAAVRRFQRRSRPARTAMGLQLLRHRANGRRHCRPRGDRRRSALPQRSLARRRRDRRRLFLLRAELGARQCNVARDGQADVERPLQLGRRSVHRDAQLVDRSIRRDRRHVARHVFGSAAATIARDRTAQAEQATIGLSRPVFDRFQLHADAGYTISTAACRRRASSRCRACSRRFCSSEFVGSSLFKDGDSAVFALRHTVDPRRRANES